MEVARLAKGGKALEAWATGIGAKGGVVDGIAILGDRVFVNTYMTGKLFAVPIQKDGKAGAAVEIKLPRELMRPDGMRSDGTADLIVAESGGTGRVSRITIKGAEGTLSVIDKDFPDGVPAVTKVGTTLYALEGQLPKRREAGAKLSPFRAVAVPRSGVGMAGAPFVEHPME
jgi:sugar lactone lactonase YvrE